MDAAGERRAAAHRRDLQFVQRLLRRDPVAVEEMGRRLACLPAMLRHQGKRLGVALSEHELEELAQDTVLAMWSKLAAYEGRATLETWAFRFASLELLKAIQRRARRPRLVADPAESLEPAAEPSPDEPRFESAEVRGGLERLPADAARVIRSRHYDQKSFDEIAADEDLPLNTVKARYYRGLARLKEHLERRLRQEERR